MLGPDEPNPAREKNRRNGEENGDCMRAMVAAICSMPVSRQVERR